jgi:hypothetical protein
MLTVKINNGETEVDIAEGYHVWFRHGGVESLIAGEDLETADREILGNLRNQIWTLTEELANHLLTLRLKETE